jgi:hypothetical protein
MMIGVWCLVFTFRVQSQTFSEWFRQSSTRLKYYARQIGALQAGISEMGQGYGIGEAGLGMIDAEKQGEYDAHNGYYASLVTVNPAIGNSGDVARILAIEDAIVARFSAALGRYRRDGILRNDRLTFIENVYNSMAQAALTDLATLTEALTTRGWQMSDGERIARVRELRTSGEERYAFTIAFTNGMDREERQKTMELAGLGTLKALYGVK